MVDAAESVIEELKLLWKPRSQSNSTCRRESWASGSSLFLNNNGNDCRGAADDGESMLLGGRCLERKNAPDEPGLTEELSLCCSGLPPGIAVATTARVT